MSEVTDDGADKETGEESWDVCGDDAEFEFHLRCRFRDLMRR